MRILHALFLFVGKCLKSKGLREKKFTKKPCKFSICKAISIFNRL